MRQQQQQFFPSLDLDVSDNWEFNFGVGIGTTVSSDRLIYKAIVGRRFTWRRQPVKGKGKGDINPPQ